MARVLGIGGVFFKSRDTSTLKAWYQRHLSLPSGGDPAEPFVMFPWRERDPSSREHVTIWSLFAQDTQYFAPSTAPFMINYIVDDLDGMLRQLREAGAAVDDKIQEEPYGRFGWAMDPEGNRFELWEPTAET